jgi:hypothetical protein
MRQPKTISTIGSDSALMFLLAAPGREVGEEGREMPEDEES